MKKTDKKREKQLCQALTRACEAAKTVTGFQWLTHWFDSPQFPKGLIILCIFSTNADLEQARQGLNDQVIIRIIKHHLEKVTLIHTATPCVILFDTEDACQLEHNGQWQRRFKQIITQQVR